MKRYARLYLYFLQFSLSRSMEFRFDFFFRTFMDSAYYVLNIALYKILFLHMPSLGGWNEKQAMVFVGFFLLSDAIYMTMASNNIWMIPFYINKGDLDYYIVRPVSSLFFLSLRDFALGSFINLIMASGIMIYFVGQSDLQWSFSFVSLLFLLLFLATFLKAMVHLLFVAPSFWFHSSAGFSQIFHHYAVVIERPDRIFRGWWRKVLLSLLPFSLMASIPCRLLIEKWDVELFLYLILICIIFFGILTFVWNRGLRAYSSASS